MCHANAAFYTSMTTYAKFNSAAIRSRLREGCDSVADSIEHYILFRTTTVDVLPIPKGPTILNPAFSNIDTVPE